MEHDPAVRPHAGFNAQFVNPATLRHPPASFEAELRGVEVLRRIEASVPLEFALIFVTQRAEIDRYAKALAEKLVGDVVLWFAYPKGSSKRYQCEFNRDTGWAAIGVAGFESVRQVAIDEDWSALRFRRTEYVKKLTRDASRMSSAAGKSRARKTDTPAE